MDQWQASRRDFLWLGAAAAASACGGCAVFGSRKADVVATLQEGTIRLSPTESAGLLETEGSLLVQAEGWEDKIVVVHAGDGGLQAVSAICTHQGCAVEYRPEAGRLLCPCHGSEFSLNGDTLKGPAKLPLKRYGVREEKGQVVIVLPAH